MDNTLQLTVIRLEPPFLASTGFLELKAISEHSTRVMDNKIACKKLAETSNLFTGPRQYRVCACKCGTALLPSFIGRYASEECMSRSGRGHQAKAPRKAPPEKVSLKEGDSAPSPKVSRYCREGRAEVGFPPAKSRCQIRWAKQALQDIEQGREVETQMCMDEIRALAETPEAGLPWRTSDLRRSAQKAKEA
jgi:hypothetical protein